VRSVRGFRDNTLGPVDFAANSTFRQPIGGAVKTVGSLEMYFPSLLKTPAARVSAFLDVGNVYKDLEALGRHVGMDSTYDPLSLEQTQVEASMQVDDGASKRKTAAKEASKKRAEAKPKRKAASSEA
jgi:outer membrane protein assembly factor BamA